MMIRVLMLLLGCSGLVSGCVVSDSAGGVIDRGWDICTFTDPIGSQPLEPNYLSLDSSRDELIIADMVRRVNRAGYANTAVQTIKLSQENIWYIVVIGPYEDGVRLDEERRVLHQLGFHAEPRVY